MTLLAAAPRVEKAADESLKNQIVNTLAGKARKWYTLGLNVGLLSGMLTLIVSSKCH